jgi:hypothetical protein
MEIINHKNEVFRIHIQDYMRPFKQEFYFDSNWLKGEIEISSADHRNIIQLEFMQVEELVKLVEWIEKIADKEKRDETIFDFIDPLMRFRLWKRGRNELLKFIYHSEDKSIYTWDMVLNEENVQEFKNQVQELLIRFPIR